MLMQVCRMKTISSMLYMREVFSFIDCSTVQRDGFHGNCQFVLVVSSTDDLSQCIYAHQGNCNQCKEQVTRNSSFEAKAPFTIRETMKYLRLIIDILLGIWWGDAYLPLVLEFVG